MSNTIHREKQETMEQGQGKQENALAIKVILVVVALLAAWGLAVFVWGIPGLYIPAVATVPIIYLVLVIIAKG